MVVTREIQYCNQCIQGRFGSVYCIDLSRAPDYSRPRRISQSCPGLRPPGHGLRAPGRATHACARRRGGLRRAFAIPSNNWESRQSLNLFQAFRNFPQISQMGERSSSVSLVRSARAWSVHCVSSTSRWGLLNACCAVRSKSEPCPRWEPAACLKCGAPSRPSGRRRS